MEEVVKWGIQKISEGLSAQRFSSEELTRYYLERISRLDGQYSAFVEVYESAALNAARAADERRFRGGALHPLDGVPFVAKDNFHVEGHPTTGGIPAWKNRSIHTTAAAIQKLLNVGCILLGKTRLTELSYSGWGLNAQTPTPINPWSGDGPDRVAGGSSSGTAVAVAAGMTPVGLGTDTGGSIRHPAAFCGLSALRPSPGRINAQGVLPLARDFDVVGLMAKSADDLRALDAVLAETEFPTEELARSPLNRIRLGVLSTEDYPCAVKAEVLLAQEAVVAAFRSLGVQIRVLRLPLDLPKIAPIQAALTVGLAHREYGTQIKARPQDFSCELRDWVGAGQGMDALAYAELARLRLQHREQFAQLWEDVDLLLCPTVPFTAPTVAEVDNSKTELFTFTRPAAYLGLCAMSFPAGFCTKGLPIGMQLIGRSGADPFVMAVVGALQQETGWHRATPPLRATSPISHQIIDQ